MMTLKRKLSLCVVAAFWISTATAAVDWAIGSPTLPVRQAGTAFWPEERDILLQKVISRIESKAQTLSAYKCRLSTVCVLGKTVEKRTYNYYFSKPGLVRMEIIQGKDKGAVLVYKQGIVYARRFPWFFSLRFKPQSRMVTTIRGGQVDQTDLGFILSILKEPGRKLSWQGKEELSGQTLEIIELRDEKAKPGEPQKGVFRVGQDGFILKYELYDSDNNLIFLQSHDNIQPEVSFSPNF